MTTLGSDKAGNQTSVTQSLNGNPLITSYGYDEVGNRISQTDANNHTTTYSYDQLGRRLGRTLPLGQTESYSYDVAGNLQSKTDFNGRTTTYAYDSMNRLLSKTADPFFSSGACANGACGATQVGFTYNNLGQRATMTDATGKTTYGYDGAARLISVATPLGTLSYNYDKQNNQTTTSWSGSGSGGFSIGSEIARICSMPPACARPLCPHVPPALLTFGGSSRHSLHSMKRLLLSLLIVAGFSSTMVAELPFVQDNYKQALEQAKQRKQPIFVECWAPW